MLDYEELKNIAQLKRLSLVNTEKDYLQDLILFGIYSNIGRELIFKGGTCLYKVYKLNRFSEDLDFTLTKRLDMEGITKKVISDLMLLNIRGRIKEIKEYRGGMNIRLLLNGPLYRGGKETQCFIPLNISKKEQVLLEPRRESIMPLYREIPTFEVFAMPEEEILAEKVRAILTRQKPRDIYDLWFLLTRKNIVFDPSLIDRKLALYDLRLDLTELRNRIERMKGLWEIDLKNLMTGELREFDRVKEELFEKLK
ncbi:MAG: hypothetical protein DRO89_02120 [Candidatus Altiarchaeales archaeon]|nr:MAG: hypothetical protein DRO89_02120 [Candidatus Altiarchaeales archaeon]